MKKLVFTLIGVPFLAAHASAPQVKFAEPLRLAIKRVSERKANTQGKVPVLMYHRIGPVEKYMIRSKANFEKDLNRLYTMGFRPVTITEYATNKMNLAPGASPVVLTFDDSWDVQFRFLKDGTIDPNCFVGVWQKFAETHPDFPIKGTFYCLANGPFGEKKDAVKKMTMLKEWGSEIASHTLHHPNLGRSSREKVMKEIGGSYKYLKNMGFTPTAFAPPYGVWPHDNSLVKKFKYGKETVEFQNAVEAGSGLSPSPIAKNFKTHRIPRIQAYPGFKGIDWWLDKVAANKEAVYVQP